MCQPASPASGSPAGTGAAAAPERRRTRSAPAEPRPRPALRRLRRCPPGRRDDLLAAGALSRHFDEARAGSGSDLAGRRAANCATALAELMRSAIWSAAPRRPPRARRPGRAPPPPPWPDVDRVGRRLRVRVSKRDVGLDRRTRARRAHLRLRHDDLFLPSSATTSATTSGVAAAPALGGRQVVGDELAHLGVAAGGGLAAHHDGDDVPAVALDVGDEVEAGGAGIAGLDAVDAFDRAEQTIVIAMADARIGEGAYAEISIVGREGCPAGRAPGRRGRAPSCTGRNRAGRAGCGTSSAACRATARCGSCGRRSRRRCR